MTLADLMNTLADAGVKRARIHEWQGLGIVMIKCDTRKHEAARSLIDHRKPIGIAVLLDPDGLPWWRGWCRSFVAVSVPMQVRS